jgi:hypothetical protein
MMLVQEVEEIMSNAIKNNPDILDALIKDEPFDDTDPEKIKTMMWSIIMGNRKAILHIARHIEQL